MRLFDAETGRHVRLERTAVHATPSATHLTFRMRNQAYSARASAGCT
ncbi:hypothetical protein ILP97_30150 [Amycolatopsis sp. H6(2020)]|nr:hypothetical protein [Amycolatopsis sp. H6(2020)]